MNDYRDEGKGQLMRHSISDIQELRMARKWLSDEYGWGEAIEVDAKAVYDSIHFLIKERDDALEAAERHLNLDKYELESLLKEFVIAWDTGDGHAGTVEDLADIFSRAKILLAGINQRVKEQRDE